MLMEKLKLSVLFLSISVGVTVASQSNEQPHHSSSSSSSLRQNQPQHHHQPHGVLRGTRTLPCPANYSPVCCNGREYDNFCTASRRYGLHESDCTPGLCYVLMCSDQYDPVCCNGNEEYPNSCQATRAGRLDTECQKGTCSQACPAVYDPVCCNDNKDQYSNWCEASLVLHANATRLCVQGACPEVLPCPPQEGEQPVRVCCNDHEEFESQCHASQNGFDSVHCVTGSCSASSSLSSLATTATTLPSSSTLSSINCPAVFDPVCCNESSQHPNICEAFRDGMDIKSCTFGECS